MAIGATMVGSITFLKKQGDTVKKGEQVRHDDFYTLRFITLGSMVLEKDTI